MRECGLFCNLIVIAFLLMPVPVPGQGTKPDDRITAKELKDALEEVRKKHKLPALGAGIVRGDENPLVVVVGVRKVGEDTLAGNDDRWHLGSNTKPMTALLLALLIESGLVAWDTPLERIFPDEAKQWKKDHKQITIAQLLTHTSGLPANWPISWFFIAGAGSPAKQRARMMEHFGTVKVKPGMDYSYSNLGYTVLGAVIDRLTESSWEEQVQKKVFEPLGIKHAGYGPPNMGDTLKHPWPHLESKKPAAGILDNPAIMNPAGRVHMSIGDYCRFLAETLRLARGEKGLLKPATAKHLFTNPIKEGPHSLSGWLGIRRQPANKKLTLIHDGSNGMNYCTAVILAQQNRAICVCTNQGDDAAETACTELQKRLVGLGMK